MLTANALERIITDQKVHQPVLQAREIKKVVSSKSEAQPGQDRYRIDLSDGTLLVPGMLASQLVSVARDGQIQQGSIIRLQDYICNNVSNRRIIIVMTMEVIGIQELIGSPQQVTEQVMQQIQQKMQQQQNRGVQGGNMGQQFQQQQGANNTYNQYQGSNPNQRAMPSSMQGDMSGGYVKQENNPNIQNQIPYNQNSMQKNNQQFPRNNNNMQQGYGQNNGPQRNQQAFGSNNNNMGGNFNKQEQNNNQMLGQSPQKFQAQHRQGAIARNATAPTSFMPIAALNPYLSGKWKIRGRITTKAEMRNWSNARGTGRVFSFDMVDQSGVEVRCTAFNDTADKFFDMVQEGQVVAVSNANLRPKRPGFNNTNCDWEVWLELSSSVEHQEDDGGIPNQLYSFTPLDQIESAQAQSVVDVIGVIDKVDAWTSIQKKDGTDTRKRVIVLKDQTKRSIEITLWGKFVDVPGNELEQLAQSGENPIVAVKGSRIVDYNGKSLSILSNAQVTINPQCNEATTLKNWFQFGGGQDSQVQPLKQAGGASGMGGNQQRITLDKIKNIMEEDVELPYYGTVVCTVSVNISDGSRPMYYPACPLNFNERSCSKKMIDQNGEGSWYCERCGQHAEPVWRYILNVSVMDFTNKSTMMAFGDQGNEIVGIAAGDLKQAIENDQAEQIFKGLTFQDRKLRIRVVQDQYQEEIRIKTNILKADKLDYSQESRALLEYIEHLMKGKSVMQIKQDPKQDQTTSGQYGGQSNINNNQNNPGYTQNTGYTQNRSIKSDSGMYNNQYGNQQYNNQQYGNQQFGNNPNQNYQNFL